MKIDGPGSIRVGTLRRLSKAGPDGDGGFASHMATDEAAAANTAATRLLAKVDALIALQEAPDPAQNRRRGLARGEDLIESLDEIRHALLQGAIPCDRLRVLGRRLAEGRFRINDPQLAAIVRDIELRCAVELAKLGEPIDFL